MERGRGVQTYRRAPVESDAAQEDGRTACRRALGRALLCAAAACAALLCVRAAARQGRAPEVARRGLLPAASVATELGVPKSALLLRGPPRLEWRLAAGRDGRFPELRLSLGDGVFAPFQLRGFDYSPVPRCCGNNDASAFQKELYERDVPRMAMLGANVIKLYGMCDGVLDASNYCGPPEDGCSRRQVNVEGVREFLDFCFQHRIFVLLASRAGNGDVHAYAHIAETYGAHPAVAGAILFDETLDLPNFNEAAKTLHKGFCRALGRNPSTTPVEESGRIITTAAAMQIPTLDFQRKYGAHVNSWGFDPYAQWSYTTNFMPEVPYKPYFLTELGLEGAGNTGCRNDCGPCPTCDLAACRCLPCACLAEPWKSFVQWMATAPVSGLFLFEWTDENWKGDPHLANQDANAFCVETRSTDAGRFNEANHGIFSVTADGTLIPKQLGNGDTFESVLKATWAAGKPGLGGIRGWQTTAAPPRSTLGLPPIASAPAPGTASRTGSELAAQQQTATTDGPSLG